MDIIITGKNKTTLEKIKEISKFKELLYFFVWRDIKVRYKQTFLGVLWVVLQPVLLVLVFSYIFKAFNFTQNLETPYPVLAFAGVLYWLLFSSIINNVSNSLTSNQNIIQKVYFPNILIPISSTLVSVFDSLIIISIIFFVFFIYGVSVTLPLVLMMLIGLIITVIFGFGLGMILGALNVRYRDVRHILPFLLQIIFFLSPVIYLSQHVPKNVSSLLVFNPLYGVINNVRIAMLTNTYSFNFNELIVAFVVSLAVLIFGFFIFNHLERQFSDFI